MADAKVVRGTLGGAVIETTQETAGRLGSAFEPEKSAPKKASSSKSEK
jgi:hypothetical protein